MNTKRAKNALLKFYDNLEAWYDGLSAAGRAACDVWIDTGNLAAILPYMPPAVARYFTTLQQA